MTEQRETRKLTKGYTDTSPIYLNHQRARNWMAKIQTDPGAPGGLRRDFMPRGHGDYFYRVDGLSVGDVVEYGADYYTGSGNRRPDRRYCVVREITPEHITEEYYGDAKTAISASDKLKIELQIDDLIN